MIISENPLKRKRNHETRIPIARGTVIRLGNSFKSIIPDRKNLRCEIACEGHDNPDASLEIVFPTAENFDDFTAFISCWFYRKRIEQITGTTSRAHVKVLMDSNISLSSEETNSFYFQCESQEHEERIQNMLCIWNSIAQDIKETDVHLNVYCNCTKKEKEVATFMFRLHPNLGYGYSKFLPGTLFSWVIQSNENS